MTNPPKYVRPILVGLMPNKTNAGPPLTGRIGLRLQRWLGLPPYLDGLDILDYFYTINLNKRHHPKLDYYEATKIATHLYMTYPTAPIVLCGREVAAIFDLAKLPFWTWTGFNVAVIPHPSGRCRVYNDPEARRRTGETLNRAILLSKLSDIATNLHL